MITFKAYRDSLQLKKYRPLPQNEVNKMVIEGRDLDKVVLSHQRLIIKVMSASLHFDNTPDDMLFELVQVANAALAESLATYKEIKIDFSYYAFMNIKNAIRSYGRHKMHIVKSAIDKGEVKYASYLHIDAPTSEEEDEFDIPYHPEEKVQQIDLELIYDLIKQEHHLFKKRYIDMYAVHLSGLSNQEVADIFKTSNQRVSQVLRDVEDKMKSNQKVIKYLKEFV